MNKTKIITGGTIGLTFLLNANIIFAAESCAVASSCEELGYKKTVSDCGESGLRCPFDTDKMYCGTKYGIIDKLCYENDEIVGVQIGDTNKCISLIDAYYSRPNSKWYGGALYNPDDNWSEWTSSGSTSNKGYYSWGYLMGFQDSCHNKDCGNSGYGVSEEQSGSWCKTVLGSNWRVPTCTSHAADDNCELYSISTNYNDIAANLTTASDAGAKITSLSVTYLWGGEEYDDYNATMLGTSSSSVWPTNSVYGISGKVFNKGGMGTYYLRCIREF
ncbi:MAG: hypothetical protein R3Y43_07265 [Alphaproteobacteria bacterium]